MSLTSPVQVFTLVETFPTKRNKSGSPLGQVAGEVFAKLYNSPIFSIIDASKSFSMGQVDLRKR